ncbi:assimilatory nitrate reductase catalytic subunit [Actinoplanes octamycinicus]|uniref:Assimilatory nitrate reductase catalytic subunit n=1 Tax=Actinoplanes octamycinicus TaxID=135948 RepID=A0A7W7GZ18_9ACTN|nr:molybdopterin oxidoreductase family protein [Actinoplanes octamycinicus]MBB4740737.1 assimilatory nitrate reductase catalytic subunit [Actinoplanes octamycinicus]GIE61726.1 molybdopterin oxidoreductase [Actinoplanes octamycinicus]
MTATQTHCPYCALQCGMTLTPGIPRVRLEPADFPVNRGGLCAKGFTAADLLDHPDRLLTPLVRKEPGNRESPLREASWEEAYDRIVTAIRDSRDRYGNDSVGAFGGGGLTNEKAYALGKFVRVALRSSAIDYNGRFCMSSAATAANRAFGIDRGLPFPLEDLAGARTVLLVGANPADAMPPSMQYLDAGRANGAKHIVVDPRRTNTANGAHLHLQPLPGTDLALANGLLHIAVRAGHLDESFIASRTENFAAVRAAVNSYWPERVERMTGVPEAQLRETVRLLADGPSMILTARGTEQHSNGTNTAQAWINLALALGLVGKPFSGYGTITGQGNGQGGREHGQKADQLPGYRRLDDPAARAHVAAVWGVDPAELPQPGRSAYEMISAIGEEGGVRVLLVLASNLVVSAPHTANVVDRLRALDFLVVSDIFRSETAELADVVLPTAQWAEEEGTMTNLEGRVIRRTRALPPPPMVKTDLTVLTDLAGLLGRGEFFTDQPRAVFEELRRASAGGVADYAGISYERIESEDGVFWPCPSEDHPGTPRLFTESFPTASGRARFIRVDHRDPAEVPDQAFPYVLTTGRNMQQYQSGNQTRRVKALTVALPEARAEIHPDLARRHGIADGDLVELRSRRGAATLRARLSDGIRPDTVFAPFHWPGANALTDPALDPHSKMPAFKVCAVAIARAGTPEGTDQ